MTRINTLLVQAVDDTGVVLVNESSGEEVFIPVDWLHQVIVAMTDLTNRIHATSPGYWDNPPVSTYRLDFDKAAEDSYVQVTVHVGPDGEHLRNAGVLALLPHEAGNLGVRLLAPEPEVTA